MFTIVVSFLIALAFVAYKTVTYKYDRFGQESPSMEPGFARFIGVLIVIAGVVLAAVLRLFVPLVQLEMNERQLVSIERNQSMEGFFIIASGGFETAQYYNLMVENENKSYSPHKIPVSSSVEILESNKMTDKGKWIEVYELRDPDHFLRPWTIGGSTYLVAQLLP